MQPLTEQEQSFVGVWESDDGSSDTLTHISSHQDYNEIKVFHRTDRDPTDKSIDWDWYYDIHPNRKP